MSENNTAQIKYFLITQGRKFPQNRILDIEEEMRTMSDLEISMIQSLDYKDPNMAFILSFFFGYLGIDRFIIGDTLLGVLKFFSFGFCFLWWFIDLFLIIRRTKSLNFEKFKQFSRVLSR